MTQQSTPFQARASVARIALAPVQRGIFLASWPLFVLNLLLPIYGKEIGAGMVERCPVSLPSLCSGPFRP